MSNVKNQRGKKEIEYRFINVRADGTVQESMEGVVIPTDNNIYNVLVNLQDRLKIRV